MDNHLGEMAREVAQDGGYFIDTRTSLFVVVRLHCMHHKMTSCLGCVCVGGGGGHIGTHKLVFLHNATLQHLLYKQWR